MASQSAEEFRKTHDITVIGQNIPEPTFGFDAFPEYVSNEIRQAGFSNPTPIQAQSWPILLSNRNYVGVAETGSGKTLAYILPAIVHINTKPMLKPGDGPICLVLAPTRELALQIESECKKYGSSSRINYTCIYGGAPKYNQINQLRKGVDIVIATPGRLIDMLESKHTDLDRVSYLVMDEADRMLDMVS